jgi:hypothetical protein
MEFKVATSYLWSIYKVTGSFRSSEMGCGEVINQNGGILII